MDLSFDVERRRDVIEYPIVDEIDIGGWDVRKARRRRPLRGGVRDGRRSGSIGESRSGSVFYDMPSVNRGIDVCSRRCNR